MMGCGRSQPVSDRMKEHQRGIKKSIRETDRERTGLERHEKKLMTDIKEAARAGRRDRARILARDLEHVRANIKKMYQMKSHTEELDQLQIEHQLRIAQAEETAELSVLVDGGCFAGKSTVAWQMARCFCCPPEWRIPHRRYPADPFVDTPMRAFCMARHSRLGAASPARNLPLELFMHIRNFVDDRRPPANRGTAVQQFAFPLNRRDCRRRACQIIDVNGADRTEFRRKWLPKYFELSLIHI